MRYTQKSFLFSTYGNLLICNSMVEQTKHFIDVYSEMHNIHTHWSLLHAMTKFNSKIRLHNNQSDVDDGDDNSNNKTQTIANSLIDN